MGDTYRSDFGPRAGPLRYHESPGCMGVLAEQDGKLIAVGVAYPAGWIQDPTGGRPIAAFGLEVRDQRLDGLWICRSREFVQVGSTET